MSVLGLQSSTTRAQALARTWPDDRLACLKGDELAWSTLIDRYKHLIYSVPFKYRASADEAADILQAVCLELFTTLPRLRKTESLRSWLLTVAAHQRFHWKQRQKMRSERENELEEAHAVAGEPIAPDIHATLEREQTVRDAVRHLPPRCREMVRLLFFEEPPIPTSAILEENTAQRLDPDQLPAAFGHGTMVAGLVRLVAPTATIMPLKAFHPDCSSTSFDILRAIYYATDQGADVINMSFRLPQAASELQRALDYATSCGVVAVASAGNTWNRVIV